ncbi:hypothetical protein BLNAU_6593 [Blattamonas nauphoetae]|uniref:Uncharacterized protein n=1 Tax=Blattamonas nauphoetae TaxID=2049346 RepID=A0ABQ9Y4C5_9EUKA|nr:hypothetical protein BLNAU_6593 [Blattamonas nauphoetae]
MTHRNYLAGMTPTHFRGLPFDVWNTLIAEVGCSFRFVVLNATVFDCHIFDRPLSTQFLAYLSSSLSLPLSQIPSFSQNRLEAVEQRHLHCFAFLTLSRPRWCPNHKAGNPPDSLNDSAENVAEEGGRGKAVGDEDLIAVVNNAHAHLLIM